MKHAVSVVVTLFLAACSVAYADEPLSINRAPQYTRVGASTFGAAQQIDATSSIDDFIQETTTTPTTSDDLHLFDFGTLVTVSCTAQTTCCWVMDSEDITIASTGQVSDGAAAPYGTDGIGSCFRVEAGLYVDQTVWRDNFRASNRVGRRAGFCTGNTITRDWPCNDNAPDCSANGICRTACTVAGTTYCTGGATPFEQIRGVFLTCVATTGTSECFVREDK